MDPILNSVPLPPPGPRREAAGQEPAAPPVRRAARTEDLYTPEEAPVSAGVYWPEKDGEGSFRILFDKPGREEEAPEAAPPGRKAGKDGEPEEKTTVCTDRVEAEIRGLRKQEARLEQQIAGSGGDTERRERLEAQLARVRRELAEKDTDAYRRRHAQYTEGGAGASGPAGPL